jgi:hypothetical protein
LESKSCYDVLPLSFRLIVLDNRLSITRSLQALVTNGECHRAHQKSIGRRRAGQGGREGAWGGESRVGVDCPWWMERWERTLDVS